MKLVLKSGILSHEKDRHVKQIDKMRKRSPGMSCNHAYDCNSLQNIKLINALPPAIHDLSPPVEYALRIDNRSLVQICPNLHSLPT